MSSTALPFNCFARTTNYHFVIRLHLGELLEHRGKRPITIPHTGWGCESPAPPMIREYVFRYVRASSANSRSYAKASPGDPRYLALIEDSSMSLAWQGSTRVAAPAKSNTSLVANLNIHKGHTIRMYFYEQNQLFIYPSIFRFILYPSILCY